MQSESMDMSTDGGDTSVVVDDEISFNTSAGKSFPSHVADNKKGVADYEKEPDDDITFNDATSFEQLSSFTPRCRRSVLQAVFTTTSPGFAFRSSSRSGGQGPLPSPIAAAAGHGEHPAKRRQSDATGFCGTRRPGGCLGR